MSDQVLWPIPDREKQKPTPLKVLREQADALKEATGGVLHGAVANQSAGEGKMEGVLLIRVPALGGHNVRLFSIVYSLEDPQSVTILFAGDPDDEFMPPSAKGVDEFTTALAKILGSKKVQRLINNLISLTQ